MLLIPPPPPDHYNLVPVTYDFLSWEAVGGADECGLFDQINLKMSGDLLDEEDVFEMTKDGRFDDETVEPEVFIRLPRGSDPAPAPKTTPMYPGAVIAEAYTPDPRQHHRIGPMNGAKPKQPMFETPNRLIPRHNRLPPRAGTQLVTDRFMDEPPTLPTPGHGRPPLRAGTQPVTDRFVDELPMLTTPGHGRLPLRAGTQPVTDRSVYKLTTLPTAVDSYDRPPPRRGTEPVCDFYRPQHADLMDTVAQLQFEIDALKFVQPGQPTSATGTPAVQPKTGGVHLNGSA